jgi:hypothetical protein
LHFLDFTHGFLQTEKKKKKLNLNLKKKVYTFHAMEGALPGWLQKWVSQGG